MSTYRRLQINSRNPWLGDRLSGLARLAAIFIAIMVLGSFGSAFAENIDTQAIAAGLVSRFGILGRVPASILATIAFIRTSLPYYLFVTMAFFAAYLVGIRYLQDIHNLGHFTQAWRYFNALLFGIGYPRLTVDDGKDQTLAGKTNLLATVGGPGYLIIQPGSLVLLESLSGAPRVCAEGLNFVTRVERIREIIDLDDQINIIEKMDATTKDGVTIRVRDINYGYRLRTGRTVSEKARQDPDAPHPFSLQAVHNMTYTRSVGLRGITPWKQMVQLAVDGAIQNYIQDNRFDDFASPRFGDTEARVAIAKELNDAGVRNRLRGYGAELLWVDLGHFEVLDKRVEAQRVTTWGAKWSGDAQVRRAFGDATRLSYMEIGRAEAQAEMLLSILEGLNADPRLETTDENVRNIILLRTSQILDGMAQKGQLPGERDEKLPPPTPKNSG